ncbi:uncharacterized protein LOC122239496 [Panthera tigris]|uniref:uncharacterized protein LOC122239496 n=1 Tax=Panthera tigris TaxID=9694 RepID=UPI001C6F7EA2|nr:uncharacterized protein LOC122239496 [Panthera tigris]
MTSNLRPQSPQVSSETEGNITGGPHKFAENSASHKMFETGRALGVILPNLFKKQDKKGEYDLLKVSSFTLRCGGDCGEILKRLKRKKEQAPPEKTVPRWNFRENEVLHLQNLLLLDPQSQTGLRTGRFLPEDWSAQPASEGLVRSSRLTGHCTGAQGGEEDPEMSRFDRQVSGDQDETQWDTALTMEPADSTLGNWQKAVHGMLLLKDEYLPFQENTLE